MNIFFELSLIIIAATVIAGVMRFFKQPLIISYIITGLIISVFYYFSPTATTTLSTFSQMGVAILLFIEGLHLSPSETKEYGISSMKIGAWQMLITVTLGYILSQILGYPLIPSLYIAVALAFSSTIVTVKLLSDKHDLEKLYGRISVGILLLQDIVAATALIIATSFSTGQVTPIALLIPLGKGLALTILIFFISKKVLPLLDGLLGKSQEFLFMFSLAWGFGIGSLFSYFGLSIEIGALLAGVALSLSPYSSEISAKLRPLRDFFLVMFFITIGMQLNPQALSHVMLPLVVFSLFTILIKPSIIMFLMGASGYKKKTSFFSAMSLAQISEFSLILGVLGFKFGHIDSTVMSLLTLLAVITTGISSYLIIYSPKLYPLLANLLFIFEKKVVDKESDILTRYDVILFGCNRVGYDFIEKFKHLGQSFLCIDYDPDVIKDLVASGINCKYGDVEDADFLDDLNIYESKMIVSTIPEFEANMFLLRMVKKNPEIIIITISYTIDDALRLYDAGADYVILPHFVGGRFVADMAEKADFDNKKFDEERSSHLDYLKQRKELGFVRLNDIS
ncbi:cation:proton antiporter [candidate division WWE3 bacterium]|nr:cation:proton antiporter [candidate division WWE3 bacterium]